MDVFLYVFVIAVLFWVFKSYGHYEKNTYTNDNFRNFLITKESFANSELGLFVALCAKVAKADGRVDELEAELIGNMFSDISSLFSEPEKTKSILKEIFDHEKQIPYNVDNVASRLYALIQKDPHKRIQMMHFFIHLAYIDGTLTHTEESMLTKIAAFLHFSSSQFDEMLSHFGSVHPNTAKESSLNQAYKLIGLGKDATNDEVKKAYRNLVKQHHPDIIKAQGANERYIEEATAKVQEINAAYEMIKKSRGI